MPLSPAWYADALAALDAEDKASLTLFGTATPAYIVVVPPTAALLVLGLVYPTVDYKARPVPRSGWRCTEELMPLYALLRDQERAATQW